MWRIQRRLEQHASNDSQSHDPKKHTKKTAGREARPKMRLPIRRKQRRRWAAAFCLLLLAGDYWFYPLWAGIGRRSFNKGENGAWLHHSWSLARRSQSDLRAMARRLRAMQIRSAYFHVRYIGKSGALRFHRPAESRRLTAFLHRAAPDVRAIAWVYVGNERGITGVDLSDASVRARMVREAVWLTTVCGFDGVQWDYEICPDGDLHLLALLRETRRALPPGKTLSVATAMWLPRMFHCWGWSESYFARVAALCDEMAVMCYDSGLYFARHYVWLVRRQAIVVTRAAARDNARCRVLLGVPTYASGGPSHHARAENLRMALKGVREGLSDSRARPATFAGVALFADYTTDANEERTWREWWLRPSP
jgi:hypothetical protein